MVSVYMTGRRHGPAAAPRPGSSSPGASSTGPGWTRGHPYSLSAAPDGRSLRITVKDLGDDSARPAARPRPGTRVLVEGPYGRLSARARTRRKVALHRRRRRHHAAAGAGRGTALRARATPSCSTASPAGRCSPRRSPCSPRERGLEVVWLPGRRRAPDSWLGDGVGNVDDLTALTYWVPDIAERDVYVCGPEALGRGRPSHRPAAAGLPDGPLPRREIRMVTR